MRRICVFCGSNIGAVDTFSAAAKSLGACMARHGIGLVYGGAKVGLMGILADTVLSAGVEVIGVIPEPLIAREIAHQELTELHVVGSMHERKSLMAELADGFITMPGGFGTLDELTEMVTWTQLGLHRKPCGLFNVEGFYDSLISFLDHAVSRGFIRPEHRMIVLTDESAERLLMKMQNYPAPVPHAG